MLATATATAARKAIAAPAPSATAAGVVVYFRRTLEALSRARSPGTLFVLRAKAGDVAISDAAAHRIIAAGLRADVIERLAAALPDVDKATLLKTIGIDKATLRRRERSKALLERPQAEAVLRLMELCTLATATFGVLGKGGAWLDKPHPVLDGERPIEHASTQYGCAKVKSILAAIRYGGVV